MISVIIRNQGAKPTDRDMGRDKKFDIDNVDNAALCFVTAKEFAKLFLEDALRRDAYVNIYRIAEDSVSLTAEICAEMNKR